MILEERQRLCRQIAIAYPWSARDIYEGTQHCSTEAAIRERLVHCVALGWSPLEWERRRRLMGDRSS